MKYKNLSSSEIIQDGDEFQSNVDGQWSPTSALGSTPLIQGFQYRRPIKEDRAAIQREKIDAIPISGEIKKAVTSLVEELSGEKLAVEKPRTYRIGQRFMRNDKMRTTYILAYTGNSTCELVNLESGDTPNSGIEVDDIYNITQKELDRMRFGRDMKLIS